MPPPARRSYLDWNASAPLLPEVRAAMIEALTLTGNPSSVHAEGRACRAALETARRSVAALAGVRPEQVIFTSGGTEANALTLSGIPAAALVVSAIEHESVLAAAPEASRLPVHPSGVVDLAALDAVLARLPAPVLVSVMAVNNQTGVIQPIDEVAALVRRHGGLLHCDAVQAAGRLPLDQATAGADLFSLSAHKLGGPAGTGALILANGKVQPTPLLRGGGQERRRRAGTETLAGIVGFGQAAESAASAPADQARLATLRDYLEHEITRRIPDVWIFGREAPRVAGTSCLALPGLSAETRVMALDLAGIAVSAGAACSGGSARPSHVLTAMGADPALVARAIRISFGASTEVREIEAFLQAINTLSHPCISATMID
ncbi:MAG: cysteine desulfurase family protein [Rhodospirillaceae bacterium]